MSLKSNISRAVFLTTAMFSFPNNAEMLERAEPLTAASSIVLVNTAGIPLKFIIRPQDGRWQNLTLQPGQNITYTCKDCPYFEFKMSTKRKKVVKFLKPTHRYSLRYNTTGQIWDVFEVK